MTRSERAASLVRRLPEIYPDAHCELNFSTPLELLVATILSAQTTDKRVNIVTVDLFRRCRTVADYAAISQDELEEIVHSTGFYASKARNLRSMANDLVRLHHGDVPRDMDALVALAGVGRKTANVVLGNAFDINVGIVVDTHVARLSHRFRLTTHGDPVKIERDLQKIVPREHWTMWSHWLIFHGRRRCFAINPDCQGCEITDLCPTAFHHGRKTKAQARTPRPAPPEA